jgi:hypothetical protein
MNKEFVPHKQSLSLKELGFDESTYFWRQHGNGISGDVEGKRDYYNRKGDAYTALPLYQQAFRFFREKYGLIGWVEGKQMYKYCIESNIPTDGQLNEFPFKTYEEAELACLDKLIEIVKSK